MPHRVEGGDVTSLASLWDVSLTLWGMASLSLAALLLARVIAKGRQERRNEARTRLLPHLLSGENSPEKLSNLDLKVATALTCELAELTRGSDLEALLARAAALGVPALLSKWLGALSPQKRLTAVETLGLFESEGLEIQRALNDRNRDVRLGAALLLAKRKDGPSPFDMVRKLRIGTVERSLMVASLMSDLASRDPEGVAALLIEKEVPMQAKIAAADALAASGSHYASLLAAMAREPGQDPNMQKRLYRALGKAGHPSGSVAILEGMQSKHADVRAAAAEAAGKVSLSSAIEELASLLSDQSWEVRYQASRALLRLGSGGLNKLWEVAASDDYNSRTTARSILAEAGAA